MSYYMGADCGSGSVRVGICDSEGHLLSSKVEAIETNNPRVDFYEQSSEEIWRKLCKASKAALAELKDVTPDKIKGIGFDATCSLVVLDKKDKPISVSMELPPTEEEMLQKRFQEEEKRKKSGEEGTTWNIIMWRDHRAYKETEEINSLDHEVLKYIGGQVSIEMESPKLLWLKRNKPHVWRRSGRFMDLTDYLAFRATGCDVRSKCTTGCKWTYLPHKANDGDSCAGWSADFFAKIGLDELVDEGYERIGNTVHDIGSSIGQGLTKEAAEELGLVEGTPVGVGLIDAHAGALGMLGAETEEFLGKQIPLERRMALISGTSTCHIMLSKNAYFVPGVWGPFRDAVIGGYWVLEPGQSATGALMEFVVKSHWAYKFVQSEAEKKQMSIFDLLNDHLKTMSNYRMQSKLMAKMKAAPSVSGFEQSLPPASSYEDAERINQAIREAKRGRPSPSLKPMGLKKIWKGHVAYLSQNLHCLPDYYGNRCPFADPSMRGVLTGLSIFNTRENVKSAGIDELAIRYLSVMQALAYSTRHILESLEASGVPPVEMLFMCGGVSKNPLFVKQHADITGRYIATPRNNETVLIGAATCGACASGRYKDLLEAMKAMNHVGNVIAPNSDPAMALYHERKYQVFKRLYRDHVAYRDIMKGEPSAVKGETTQCEAPSCTIM
mmetsp:Transcript_15697/g.31916  ORF Transcript_15697/g.31916 Transcript_15697/m.31916 type:complete len:667 (-) Transcript_15697:603-2603(-)|eukprot:CAMPEP_0167818060 /NCGR_PEP_ID=MMETSP0112_2-20121227/4582_1 /TAXON_ID=91324 /ORGANISM="Lotharella globosa, Strain CCCM811" /LENGTH=666 /DNA_ID=CAMNT_0007717977 /DNA_START=35 /DNA_END=2035 /DNA_ORIENTATION=+